uniref:G-protein coupled receptors family 1 profile domain-containing protein n=1 Tax=Prolemur simus TaxID=1328070 RepID=A0A8C8ZW32_PROSS
MGYKNQTSSSDFTLLGLFSFFQTSLVSFLFIFVIFVVTVAENTLIILLILSDSRLHTPMYFLLSQRSSMDILHISNIVPQMLSNFLSDSRTISFAGCGFQVFLSLTLLGGECLLLAAMSCDCYVAICHPLCYAIFMYDSVICLRMTLGSWSLGAADGLVQAVTSLSFPYCSAHEIDHFFCEAPTLVRLACADTSVFVYVMYICCVLMLLVPFSLILTSYSLILAAVLRMCSTEALRKAFTTCSSHLAVVGLFYRAAIFIYMRPKSYRSAAHDKVASAFYTIFTPMLYPLIYSLRNSEVKGALERWRGKCINLKHQQR